MQRPPLRILLAALWVFLIAGRSFAATVAIDVAHPTHGVSPQLFGSFFEEINLAGEGGLYGELIRNRAFNNSASPDYWTLVTQGSATGQMSVDNTTFLNVTNTSSLKLTMLSGSGSVGAANSGYYGIALQSGSVYNFSCYATGSSGFTGPLTVALENSAGSSIYAQATFSGVSGTWQKFTAALTPTVSDTNSKLVISIPQAGTVWMATVSLFPQATFNNRPNGMRADIANMIAAMKPAFLRFPGGNFIEGTTIATAERWKTTIGDISTRPGHWNSAWSYLSTDGLGYHEYLQYCEDLGMQPLLDIYAGLSLGYNGGATNTVPLGSAMTPYVQDALDAIQYANGDATTTWGAVRAANGHPAPFNLQYIEIGNENGGTYYNNRYPLFYDAIKAAYPNMRLITPNWGGNETARPLDITDEHYYSSAATFMGYSTKYDSYARPSPQIFVGEYAVTSGYGTYGNLSAALGEAAFMTGMERNSDIVVMASYAPLLANVSSVNWHPNAIYYDNSRVFGTPSYYVQKIFANNTGTQELPVTITYPPSSYQGAIGLSTWSTQAAFNNLTVTDTNSNVLYQSNFASTGTSGWSFLRGTWAVSGSDGSLQQTANDQDDRGNTGNTGWTSYTYSLQARKISGAEGFLIMFYVVDTNNWVWWNIGGWGNTLDGIEQSVNGTKTVLSQVAGSVQTGVWYNIKIQLNGPNVSCYLNNTLIQSVTLPTLNPIYASTSLNSATHEVILKAVNANSTAISTTVNLSGLPSISSTATSTVLTSASSTAENSLTNPSNVIPVTNTVATSSTSFVINLPAYSVTALRIQAPVAQPQNVSVSSTNGAVVTWSPAAGASTYTVNRASSSSGPWTAIATGLTSPTYIDTTAQSGAVYYYTVTAANAAGAGTASADLVAMPIPPIAVLTPQGANASVTFPSTSGVTYQLQQNTVLTGGTWANIGAPAAGTGQPLQIIAPNGMQSPPQFFRLNMTLPSP